MSGTNSSSIPAVFLDRDNTLIANDGDLGDPGRVILFDGVKEGLRRLRDAGYRLVVITNQGGVARGKYTETHVQRVHQRISELVGDHSENAPLIDRFYYCPHHPEAVVEKYCQNHPWRKPEPGMLLQAKSDLDLDLARSWFIGDQARDIQAGRAVNCQTVLINQDADIIETASASFVVKSFPQAVDAILF